MATPRYRVVVFAPTNPDESFHPDSYSDMPSDQPYWLTRTSSLESLHGYLVLTLAWVLMNAQIHRCRILAWDDANDPDGMVIVKTLLVDKSPRPVPHDHTLTAYWPC